MAFVIGDSCIGCGSCAGSCLLELLAITVVFSLLMVHSVFHVVHVQVHVLLEQFQRSNPHRTLLS